MKSEPTLHEFVRYNTWANQTLLSLCMTLDEPLMTTNIDGSAGTILQTFGHLLRAEAGFLERIHGTCPHPDFAWEGDPSLEQMTTYADALGAAFLTTINTIPPTQNVHQENDVWSFDYQARLIFMSHIYHGIAHRTNITTFLNGHGIALPELDVWGYQDASPHRFDAKLVRKTPDNK